MLTYRNLGNIGRLGNALFELAATIGIARSRNEEVVFPANWLHRPYFSVPDELFADEIPEEAEEAWWHAEHIDNRVRIYLQDTHLFWPIIDEIREYFRPSEAATGLLLTQNQLQPNTLGVHVRRGDNVYDPGVPNKHDYHLTYPYEYYQRGIDSLGGGAPFAVFSDDIPWCQDHFQHVDFWGNGQAYWKEHEERFGVDEPQDWIDLFQLAQCERFVISGSTFGVWGAILADVPPENIVRPDRVYGPILQHIDAELLFRPDWGVVTCY